MTNRKLSQRHAVSLGVAIHDALQFTRRAREWLARDAEKTADEHELSSDRIEQIEQRLTILESGARRIMEIVPLPSNASNLRGQLRSHAAILWANLIDSESGPMRRYGEPPEWYANEIDPELKVLELAAHEILYLSAETKTNS